MVWWHEFYMRPVNFRWDKRKTGVGTWYTLEEITNQHRQKRMRQEKREKKKAWEKSVEFTVSCLLAHLDLNVNYILDNKNVFEPVHQSSCEREKKHRIEPPFERADGIQQAAHLHTHLRDRERERATETESERQRHNHSPLTIHNHRHTLTSALKTLNSFNNSGHVSAYKLFSS